MTTLQRTELLHFIRQVLPVDQAELLEHIAGEDPRLFVVELVSAHRAGHLTLPRATLRMLNGALTEMPVEGTTTNEADGRFRRR